MGRPPLYRSSSGGMSGGNTANATATSDGNPTSSSTAAHQRTWGWQPPLWLTGEQRQSSRPVSQYTLPVLNNHDAKTYQAVVASIKKQQSGRFYKEHQELVAQKASWIQQREQIEACQEQLVDLGNSKEEGLADIRELREEETESALASMEKKLRSRHDKEFKERRVAWKRKIEQECNDQRQKRKMEEKQQRKEEAESKKEGESSDHKNEAADSNTKDTATVGTSVKGDDAAKQNEADASPGEVVAGADKALSEPTGAESEAELKAKRLSELRAKVDKLNEDRSEMVWLLKQAIKAEEKSKPHKLAGDKKPESRINTSKQA